MVFNATFNNILAISWRTGLLVEETAVPGENHRPAESHWQTLSRNVESSTPRLSGIRTHNISGNGHWLYTITTTTAPSSYYDNPIIVFIINRRIQRKHINHLANQGFNTTFNNIFSYIVGVSFIGAGNRSMQRKPPTRRRSLRNAFFLNNLNQLHSNVNWLESHIS